MNPVSYYCAAPFALAAALSAALSFNSGSDAAVGAAGAAPGRTAAAATDEGAPAQRGGGFLANLLGGDSTEVAQRADVGEAELRELQESVGGFAERAESWFAAQEEDFRAAMELSAQMQQEQGGWYPAQQYPAQHGYAGGVDHAAMERHRAQMQWNQVQSDRRNQNWQAQQHRNDAAHQAFIESIRR